MQRCKQTLTQRVRQTLTRRVRLKLRLGPKSRWKRKQRQTLKWIRSLRSPRRTREIKQQVRQDKILKHKLVREEPILRHKLVREQVSREQVWDKMLIQINV